MDTTKYKSLTVAPELHLKIKVYAAEHGLSAGDLVEKVWAAYLAKAGLPPLPTAEVPDAKYPYRPENRVWHERLEMTLNDPDEALGIQKNLEWAERTVRGKTQPRKASGL
jgi:hypothetical protein